MSIRFSRRWHLKPCRGAPVCSADRTRHKSAGNMSGRVAAHCPHLMNAGPAAAVALTFAADSACAGSRSACVVTSPPPPRFMHAPTQLLPAAAVPEAAMNRSLDGDREAEAAADLRARASTAAAAASPRAASPAVRTAVLWQRRARTAAAGTPPGTPSRAPLPPAGCPPLHDAGCRMHSAGTASITLALVALELVSYRSSSSGVMAN